MRHLLALVLLAFAGCGIPEAKIAQADAEPSKASEPLRIVHIAAPRVKANDPATVRRLEEAIGVASSVLGLEGVVIGGDVIANDSPDKAEESIGAFASLAGIIAAKRVVVIGERERKGAMGRAEVF